MGCRTRWSAALVTLVACAPGVSAGDRDTDPATSSDDASESTAGSSSTMPADSTETSASGESTTTGDEPGPSVVCAQGDGFCLQIDPEAPHCFCPEAIVSPISYPHAVVTADVDGDGWLDVIAADKESFEAPSRLRIWHSGEGFAAGSMLAELPVSLETVVLGDLDEDGVLDIVGAPKTGSDLHLLRSNGDALPTTLEIHTTAPSEFSPAVALADVDADGHLDLLALTNESFTVYDLAVWPGLGDGTFAEPVVRQLGRGFVHTPFTLSIADLDEDGVDDVVALGNLWMRGVAGGGGTLSDSVYLEAAWLTSFTDADGDGHLDAFWVHVSVDSELEILPVTVHRGEGGGAFSLLHTWSLPGKASVTGGWGDLDDDGVLDLVFAVRPYVDEMSYFVLGHAHGAGVDEALIESTPLPHVIGISGVADLTHDGRTDVLAVQRDSDETESTLLVYAAQP